MIYNTPLDDKIVIFGMSCVGKTTFAKSLPNHYYYCFDALFNWHIIESLGLSIDENLKYIQEHCDKGRWVLDGWHLADSSGRFLPVGAKVYVIYADYSTIISQYRIEVHNKLEHWPMFQKWYGIDYRQFDGVRFFENNGSFIETDYQAFCKIMS